MPNFTSVELLHLAEKLKNKYQVDLMNYAQASLERRVERFHTLHHSLKFPELSHRLYHDSSFFDHFIKEITVNTTEMFRDPECWNLIREKVLPILEPLPTIRIWHAGCSSGEEIYSMLILLKEENLLEKASIIASDLNQQVIETAKQGRYPLKNLDLNAENYFRAGGRKALSNYYGIHDKQYIMNSDLAKQVRFIKHDLSTGMPFSKFDLILCRNVLIYFNKTLQETVFTMFRDSLFKKGFVVLGKKESMSYYSDFCSFTEFDCQEKIYRLK